MKRKWNKTSALLVASTLAVIGLVIFQWQWMRHSRLLAEEIFNQRVCMAVCSTMENYEGGALCQPAEDLPHCHDGAAASTEVTAAQLCQDPGFNADLRKSLDFYHIQLDYQMSPAAEKRRQEQGTYQCAVPVASTQGTDTTYLNLDFPDKEAFVLSKMNYMVIATILILLFTSVVLLFANWSLLQQKRLLQTNVDFFNNTAHEFRTPITNVSLAVNMLARKHEDLQDNQLLDIIRRENAKLLTQVERVLHLARLENGDYTLQKERLAVQPLLQSVTDEMAMQIEARRATVTLDVAPTTLELLGDRLHLANVFRNLLDNALKYGGDRPDIHLSARDRGNGILISVQDNGIGISPAQVSLIFEKFQRAGQGDLHERKGFGLGLAYVKSMVELHKGFVRVHSEVDRGSRFDVFLPVGG